MDSRDMLYCPGTGVKDGECYANARFSERVYREMHPRQVWKYNPFTGKARPAEEVKEDPYGKKL